MQKKSYPSFRSTIPANSIVKVAGAHHALAGLLVEEAGFQAVWSSSFEVSASRGLPDASILSMTEYLTAAANIQKVVGIPVVADCDTGYGGNLNVTHMVHEFEDAGITAICIEDKLFPKMNSFAPGDQALLTARDFARKITTAKNSQSTRDFFVIARTEALISGLDVKAALKRCAIYADCGADAVLIHSKSRTRDEVMKFLDGWNGQCPVVIVPTTYPAWHADEMAVAGVSVVIYANHGLRATVTTLRDTYHALYEAGESTGLEDSIASVADLFALQQLDAWQKLGA
jgi:phosphoenolpyruvate phosphomutase